MSDNYREDISHGKRFVFGDHVELINGLHYFKSLSDYYIHYLKHYGVQVEPGSYIDTISDSRTPTGLTDLYSFNLYRDGKKLNITSEGVVFLSGDDNSKEYMMDMVQLYYIKRDSFGNEEEWKIAQHNCDNVYSLGLEYNGKAKKVSISNDEHGNVIIYFNERKSNSIGLYPARYRKGGKKYYIDAYNDKYTTQDFIEAMVGLINREKNSPEMIELFELMIRDPRMEFALNLHLDLAKKINSKANYDESRKIIEQEYQEKLAALDRELLQANLVNQYSDQYNGLVPEKAVKSMVKEKLNRYV